MAERDITKEKWVFVQHEDHSEYFGNIIANRGSNPTGHRVIRTISVQLKRGTEAENLAYANLMTAAPDLLAALKLAKDYSELPDEVLDIVDDAIAKAEGRS